MIGYKDMTFCPFDDCKNFGPCDRSLTEQVRRDAENWWGSKSAPIYQWSERPDCFEKDEDNFAQGIPAGPDQPFPGR